MAAVPRPARLAITFRGQTIPYFAKKAHLGPLSGQTFRYSPKIPRKQGYSTHITELLSAKTLKTVVSAK
ncbi:hypothetical protein EBB07_32385 [Paenibacillaceae bacterium]|nr:hypothetical protein EBB07_32385 [Paenibacillaceae bacterium]